ncbi:MAG: histidine phosphatase family protein, partial [Lawsonibacter sp.]|nr:histidine phosphatase family protein [Lawsonibacter sp.]
MTTIYLVRHAEAEGNLYRRVHGWYNSLITENGFAQIGALEERFRDIEINAVYSSDLYRTMTTARAVYGPKNLPLNTDPGLREMNLGNWEDMTFGFVRRRWPEELDRFNRTDPTWTAPNGENFYQLGERLEQTVRRLAARHSGQTIALFSHGMAIRQLIALVKGLPPEKWDDVPHGDNTAVTCLIWDGERLSIVFEQDNSHLPKEISTLARQAWWRKSGKAKDVNLWYWPIDWEKERDIYLEARREAWTSTHGEKVPFDGEGFLQNARANLSRTPWGVTLAFAGDALAGVLELDPSRYAADKAGYIPFCYIVPER